MNIYRLKIFTKSKIFYCQEMYFLSLNCRKFFCILSVHSYSPLKFRNLVVRMNNCVDFWPCIATANLGQRFTEFTEKVENMGNSIEKEDKAYVLMS